MVRSAALWANSRTRAAHVSRLNDSRNGRMMRYHQLEHAAAAAST